ncbi:MAG TPA: ATP-binding protein [Myxococcaceae bacterium]|nr:ATP-binding protein [Myxococcaceae bacterium]
MARSEDKKAQPPAEARAAEQAGGTAPGALRAKLAGLADPLVLLEGLFLHSPVPYSVFDMEGRCLLTNPAYRTMFGTEPPPEYNVFQDEVARQQGIAELIRRAFQGETVQTPVFWYDPRELRHIQVTQARRAAISCTFFPLAGQGGEVHHVAIAYKDVTVELTLRDGEEERRTQLLRELAEERARLQEVLDNLPAGVILAEASSGRLIFGNAQLERLLRQPLPLGSRLPEYQQWKGFHADGRAVQWDEWPLLRALRGETVLGQDIHLQRGDGTLAWLRMGAAPIRHEGEITAGVVAFYDIEQERRAQGRLGALADISTALSQATGDFSAALEELARLCAEVLSECCVLTLLNEETGTLEVVAAYHPEPEAQHLLRNELYGAVRNEQGAASHVVSTGQPLLQPYIDQSKLPEATSPGVRRFVERYGLSSTLLVPLRVQGKVLGTLGVSRGKPGNPYTLEDQEFLQELADRAALTIQNVRLLKTTQEAVRLRDEFLSVASHELKTPLTPLSLKLQALARTMEPGRSPATPERLAGDVETMRRQVRRLTDLINDLLDVARISGGRLKLRLEDVELTGLVREVVSRFEPEAEREGGTIEVSTAEPFAGHWDRLRLEQVVTNLLSNALKYGAGKPVRVHVEAQGHQARLTVRDEGIGVEPRLRTRIFEKFERAVSDRHYGGLGLGLYITRQIVEALGGNIEVESEPQRGATFTVLLPLSGPPREQARG